MTIQHRQVELAVIHAEVFEARDGDHHDGGRQHHDRHNHDSGGGGDHHDRGDIALDDQELIQRALEAQNGAKFMKLWEGDRSDYSSASEADLAFCSLLVFWTAGAVVQVDRLFRQSGLYREKWDTMHGAQTYGAMTIGKALEGAQGFYSGHSNGQQPEASPRPFSAQSISKWPDSLAPEAHQGLVGEVVAMIGPHTEADPTAILLDFLVEAGNAMGRGPHAIAEADRHGTILNIVLVGETAKGRKGSTHGRVKDLLWRVDLDWADGHITGGLSSGEGLIWEVRDPIENTIAIKEKGRVTGAYETEVVDQGVTDKRLLVVESEFASTLKMMAREGNTLSPIIRQAWDSGNLRAITKNDSARATAAHVSIIGHITKDELLRYLQDTEMGNGFANRFL